MKSRFSGITWRATTIIASIALVTITFSILVTSRNLQNTQEAKYSATIPLTPTPVIDRDVKAAQAKADWKVYRNEKYNYLFQYPPSSRVNENPNSFSYPEVLDIKVLSYLDPDPWGSVTEIRIIVWDSLNDVDNYNVALANGRTTKLNNYQAIYFVPDVNVGPSIYIYFLPRNGKLYEIMIEQDPATRDPSDLSNLILSTFKFLE